jgi:hypothetical protein
VAKLAIGATVGIGGIALLAACGADAHDDPTAPDTQHPLNPGGGGTPTHGPRDVGGQMLPGGDVIPPPETPADRFVRSHFKAFDRNHAGGISQGEVTRVTHPAIEGSTIWTGTDAQGGRHWKYRTGHANVTTSMQHAFNAAKGLGTKDARASWAELAKLAARFDTDGRVGLGGAEQRRFLHAFGTNVTHRENVWTGWQAGVEHPDPPHHAPIPDPYPTPGTGHTSGGDDNDYPSTPPSGGTSSGDDGPSWPSGGTSSGDDGPSWPSSPGGTSGGDDGGTSAPSDGGNSSDNGNPGEDDF